MKKRVAIALIAGVTACSLTGCTGTPVVYNSTCDCNEAVAELTAVVEAQNTAIAELTEAVKAQKTVVVEATEETEEAVDAALKTGLAADRRCQPFLQLWYP